MHDAVRVIGGLLFQKMHFQRIEAERIFHFESWHWRCFLCIRGIAEYSVAENDAVYDCVSINIHYIYLDLDPLFPFFVGKNEQEKMVRDSARHYRGIFPYHVDFKSSCLTLGLFFSRIVEISKNQSRSYREKKIGQQGGKQDGGSPIF